MLRSEAKKNQENGGMVLIFLEAIVLLSLHLCRPPFNRNVKAVVVPVRPPSGINVDSFIQILLADHQTPPLCMHSKSQFPSS